MDRRVAVTVVLACSLVLSGCAGSITPDTPPTGAETETPSFTTENEVDIPPCPEKPDSLTRENVAEFATRFEAAYVTRRTLQGMTQTRRDRLVSIGAGATRAENANVTSLAEGFVVNFTATGTAYEYRSPAHNTTVVADPGIYRVSYFVGDGAVRRSLRFPDLVDPDPRDGRDVQCPPS